MIFPPGPTFVLLIIIVIILIKKKPRQLDQLTIVRGFKVFGLVILFLVLWYLVSID